MTDLGSGTDACVKNGRFELSDLQHAWMSEIGLERRILARYRSAGPTPMASDASASASASARAAALATVRPAAASSSTSSSSTPSSRPNADLAKIALKQARSHGAAPTPVSAMPGLQPVGAHLAKTDAVRIEDLPSDWADLSVHANACQACGLQAQRDRLVFGAGDTDQPDWLVVGEAPGKADDRTGLPFQGKTGKLLHAMLVAAGVHPASLVLGTEPQGIPAWSHPTRMYFANLIKCRPLGNRTPTPSEVSSCIPYLMQQIELLQPKRILGLGRLAAQALLQADADIEDLRGRVHHLTTASGSQIPLVVTWHPAALLMHPQNKGQAWIDLNLAKDLGTRQAV